MLHSPRPRGRSGTPVAQQNGSSGKGSSTGNLTVTQPSRSEGSGNDQTMYGDATAQFTEKRISTSISFMTVPVEVIGCQGGRVQATAMLDPASSTSYITEDIAQKAGLTGPSMTLSATVLGGEQVNGEHQRVNVNVRRVGSENGSRFGAWVMPTITAKMVPTDWANHKYEWEHLKDIEFPTLPTEQVDILIGANAIDLHRVLEERCGGPGEPIAKNTPLGWVCLGPSCQEEVAPLGAVTQLGLSCTFHAVTEPTLDEVVQNFWDVEAVGMKAPYLTPAEKQAERQTNDSIGTIGGRVELGVPWVNSGGPQLSGNRPLAEQRLRSLERSLRRQGSDIQEEYSKVLQNYQKKDYIRPVSREEVDQAGDDQWFLPHFPVIRRDKATTKVRVVYDAAAKWNGRSLNDEMLTGPKLQNDLVKVLLRFCLEPIALVADISEMFLQVVIRKEDRRYLRFLWRESPEQPMTVYEFQRLVFGLKASPYLAGKALQQVATSFGSSYPEPVMQTVSESFYVDDLLHSEPTVESAISLQSGIQHLLQEGGFTLRKWLSNSREVMEKVPPDHRAPSAGVPIGQHIHPALPLVKTLGVAWQSETDTFTFRYQEPVDLTYTRRTVLSKMATVFDPRGQISPFTIRARVMLQEAWILDQGWDEELPEHHRESWRRWFAELPDLQLIRVDRCFKLKDIPSNTANVSIHTFCDASEHAFAAACYIRAEYPTGERKVTLAMAKARTSPMKKATIPKLELKGAVLATHLSKEVGDALNIPVEQHFFWSDSMNVLWWVRSHSKRFKTDVGNRIAEIQMSSQGRQWRHVPGKLNPADKATRGLTSQQLANDLLWWTGPDYLKKDEDAWPATPIVVPAQLPGEVKKKIAMSFVTVDSHGSRLRPERYSSWLRFLRVTAWCLRVCRRNRTAAQALTAAEMEAAERLWIAKAQRETYPQTFRCLQAGQKLLASDPLLPLQPELDDSQEPHLIRVGGRLKLAEHLPYDLRQPVILPQKHRVTELIIAQEDIDCEHSVGHIHLLSNLSQRFWIVRGKAATKSHRLHCPGCKRRWNKPAQQLMGPVPKYRISEPLRPFLRVGVDYGGPFYTKQGRGRAQAKRYLCLFTCLQIRACHLELAYSLDTEGFLMALTRFVKRRGTPEEILSDNGSNFVSAERELRKAVQALDNDEVSANLANRKIKWRFNPPQAPHFGGVFESMIKAAKRALQPTLSRADLTDEELHTAFVQAEALLNSRPLTAVTTDSDDLRPLTPTHFLAGHVSVTLPMEEATSRVHPHRRWEVVQRAIKDAWKRWIREMIPGMNVRQKWLQRKRNIEVGDVVLYMEGDTPRGSWPLGRVERVYPGKDGIVRVVDVRCNGRSYKRPIHRLIPLEIEARRAEPELERGVKMKELL